MLTCSRAILLRYVRYLATHQDEEERERTGVLHVEPIARCKRCEELTASSLVGEVDTSASELESPKNIASRYIAVCLPPLHPRTKSERKVEKCRVHKTRHSCSLRKIQPDDPATIKGPDCIIARLACICLVKSQGLREERELANWRRIHNLQPS